MNIPKEAIEKAIEGGWRKDDHAFLARENKFRAANIVCATKDGEWQKHAFDPSFWQSLGKALGWDEVQEDRKWADSTPDPMWGRKAMLFYSLIITGGDTKAFWEDLLANKTV